MKWPGECQDLWPCHLKLCLQSTGLLSATLGWRYQKDLSQSFPGLLFGQGEAPYNSLQNEHWAFLLFSRSPGPTPGSIHWEYTLPCLSTQGTRENDDVVSEDLVQQDVQVSHVDGGLYGSVRSLMEGERSGALGWGKGQAHQESLDHSLFFIGFHQKTRCRFISEVACMNEVRECVEVK